MAYLNLLSHCFAKIILTLYAFILFMLLTFIFALFIITIYLLSLFIYAYDHAFIIVNFIYVICIVCVTFQI
jgi:hypothetical protein